MFNNKVAVLIEDKPGKKEAALSRNLQIPLTESAEGYDFLLVYAGDRLELRKCSTKGPGPLYVDFSSKPLDFRRRRGGGRKEPLARAAGLKHNNCPVILDATAGLGRDSFILAGLGCSIYLRERSPVVAALLKDGILRGLKDKKIRPIMERMQLDIGEARSIDIIQPAIEVVYLDPMYPENTQKAQVKKEMQFLRKIIGRDNDIPELLAWALKVAVNRVVVKRPRKAPPITGPSPSFAIKEGKHRLDVYFN
ncbi:MAG: class I SAM-dependent methyltransferase [Desulfobia sp.]